jgi:hypothetical protein
MYLYTVMKFAASLLYNIFDVWNARIVVKPDRQILITALNCNRT